MSLIATTEASPGTRFASDERPTGALPLFGAATLLTYAQAVLGGLVSTNHAGLACPDWPTCDGQWFPPMEGLVGLQMMHRYGAYTLVLVMIAVALRARTVPDGAIRAGGSLALSLTLTQVVLGVCNVLLGTPAWLSAAHLATAAAILAVLVITTWRVARMPARILELAAEGAR
jgi:cytochrome c oxidase assembly protein subunit 15